MADGSAIPLDPGLRSLSSELEETADLKLLQITRMIDMMPSRGEADLLLAPVRSRLATLRPPRPMTPTRLLFTPFDPVLVPAGDWAPGRLSIPRSIVTPIAGLLLGGGGTKVPQIPACINGDDAALTRCAGPFWTGMAQRLADIELPQLWSTPSWQAKQGFTLTMVEQLVPLLTLVLRRSVEIRTLPAAADPACEPALAALLSEAVQTGPLGWGIMLALLFDRVAPDLVAMTASALLRGSRGATALAAGLDLATAEALDRIELQIGGNVPDGLLEPHEMNLRLTLIGRIESFRRLRHRPAEEQRRIGRLREALAVTNRRMFEHTLRERLTADAGMAGLNPSAQAVAETVRALEAGARGMRRFALAAGKLGDTDQYERLLAEAAARTAGSVNALSSIDRMRLTELLIGSDKAAQLFDLA